MRPVTLKIEIKLQKCIRKAKFSFGRYIVGYTFGNHVLRLRLRVAVKLDFRPYIRRNTSLKQLSPYSRRVKTCLHPFPAATIPKVNSCWLNNDNTCHRGGVRPQAYLSMCKRLKVCINTGCGYTRHDLQYEP